MEDHGFAVARKLQVAFDRIVLRDRCGEGGCGVLDHALCAVMIAAMRDRPADEPVKIALSRGVTRIGLFDLGDRLDLDGDIDRQRSRADRRARMPALVAEDLDQQVGGAIDHLGMVGEVGHAIDEADKLDDALELVEIAAAGILELRHDIDGAQPRRLARLPRR